AFFISTGSSFECKRIAGSHGMRHNRGAAPLTTLSISRNGWGNLPGASAITTAPTNSTSGVCDDAHCCNAVCKAYNPWADDRATTRQACRCVVSGQAVPQSTNNSGSTLLRLDAPAPPCAATTATGAVRFISRAGSLSVTSGAVTPVIGGSWLITCSGKSSSICAASSRGWSSWDAKDSNHEE